MSDHDLIVKLRETLVKSRDALVQQAATIERLNTPPNMLGIVVENNPMNSRLIFRNGDLVIGTPGTPFEGVMGRITNPIDSDGDILVAFGTEDRFVHVWDHNNHAPSPDARVKALNSSKPTIMVAIDGKVMQLLYPEEMKREFSPGTQVVCNAMMQIIDVIETTFFGEIATFVRYVHYGKLIEVSVGGERHIIYAGKFSQFSDPVEEGDRIVLDPTGIVAMDNLGQEEEAFTVEMDSVSWDQVGGLDSAKEALREAIELPREYQQLFYGYGKKPLKGVVLHGPPGCGKTLLGKAAATAMRAVHRTDASPFLYIKGPELLSRYVGDTEAAIRGIFERARRFHQKKHSPMLIFIDEADAILRVRGNGVNSDIFDKPVAMFLTEMDGFEDSGSMVILATNRLDLLDPAVLRDGRMARIIDVGRPDQATSEDIFAIHLANKPFHNGYNVRQVAKYAAGMLFAEDLTLYELHSASGVKPLTLSQITSGAMIFGIVDRATSIALHRDINLGYRRPSGICMDDISAAIANVLAEQRKLKHDDDLAEAVRLDPAIHRIEKVHV